MHHVLEERRQQVDVAAGALLVLVGVGETFPVAPGGIWEGIGHHRRRQGQRVIDDQVREGGCRGEALPEGGVCRREIEVAAGRVRRDGLQDVGGHGDWPGDCCGSSLRVFFFEKKKQKTFGCLGWAFPRSRSLFLTDS